MTSGLPLAPNTARSESVGSETQQLVSLTATVLLCCYCGRNGAARWCCSCCVPIRQSQLGKSRTRAQQHTRRGSAPARPPEQRRPRRDRDRACYSRQVRRRQPSPCLHFSPLCTLLHVSTRRQPGQTIPRCARRHETRRGAHHRGGRPHRRLCHNHAPSR